MGLSPGAVGQSGCQTEGLFEMFTEPARQAIARAQDEARDMGHGTVQVEHLLLGLFSDRDGIAGGVLVDFGLTIEAARQAARQRPGARSGLPTVGKVPSFSEEAKDALRSANRVGLGEPGTHHLLIVIMRRGEGGACDLLRALGVDPNRVRFETKKRWMPASFPKPGARSTVEARLTGWVSADRIREIEFDED